MELIPHGTNIDFFAKAKYAFVLSFIIIVGSIYIWIEKGQSRYGIDFLGGHEFVIRVDKEFSADHIRDVLNKGGIGEVLVQSFEIASNEYSVKMSADAGDAKTVREKVDGIFKASFADKYSIIKTDYVGPVIGDELKKDAVIAIVFGLVGMLVYIAFRFEMSFAFGAVVALFHDVTVCIGFYLLFGHNFTMGALAAALTIVGYSVNDTIVIFDRVREEVLKTKNYNLKKIMNESVNVTLSRTIITSLLTLFTALSLLLIGGGSIADLSLFLVVGIITGSYSTIYIASPAALFWERLRSKNA